MKIAFVHISDIHLQGPNQRISDAITSVAKVFDDPDIAVAERVFITISGDVADSGKQSEYEAAAVYTGAHQDP